MNLPIKKPWGKYIVIKEWKKHKLKGLSINPGECISLQRHKGRQETWFIIKGEGTVEVGSSKKKVAEGDEVVIPVGEKHRITASTSSRIILLEIQKGMCLEEDIERLEDKYGRSCN